MKSVLATIIFLASVSASATSLYRGEYVATQCVSADKKVQVELVLHTEDKEHIFLGFPTVGGYATYKASQSASLNFKNGVKYTAKFTGGNMSLDLEEYTYEKRNNRKGTFTSSSYGSRGKKVSVKCAIPIHRR